MQRNILHIIQGGKGGTLEYLKMMLPKLDKNNYNITVICHGEIYEELTEMGINTVEIEMSRRISLKHDSKAILQINRYIQNHKVDLIHLHSSKAGILGRVVAKINRIPSVYNPHGWSFNIDISETKKKLYSLFEKIAAPWGDKIVLISDAELNDGLKRNISCKDKFIVINNGIDVKKFSKPKDIAFKESLGLSEDIKVVGMSCRLTEQKSPTTFIEIARKVTDKYDNCKFILVGDGHLRKEVEERIQQLNLQDKVIMVGWTTVPEKYTNIFDIGVLTSKWEGFGLALAEYMVAGKPVVASNVDGIPYVVRDKIDGFLCDPNNIDEFAKNILKLLNEQSLYKQMSESGRKRAEEKFNIDRVIQEHEKLYEELINKGY